MDYSHSGDDGEEFRTTVTFEAQGNQNKLTMLALFPTAAARDYVVKKFGVIEGGKQTLQRLADCLPSMEKIKSTPSEKEKTRMRELKLQVQISVDGFVSGKNQEMDWMV